MTTNKHVSDENLEYVLNMDCATEIWIRPGADMITFQDFARDLKDAREKLKIAEDAIKQTLDFINGSGSAREVLNLNTKALKKIRGEK